LRQPVSPNSVVARTGGLVESQIDNEIVALNIESGVCYGLNSVGARVWQMLAAPIRVNDICRALIAEYEVDPDLCEHEVIELIMHLHAEKLVAVTDGP